LAALSVVFALLSVTGAIFPPDTARWIIMPLIMLWGFVGWSFPSAQQTHIASLAPKLAPITLSLNASAIYLGASLGALLGSLVVAHGTSGELGWVGALCVAGALLLSRLTRRHRAVAAPESQPIEVQLSKAA
jgi:predicted MFS family arabinose efflux permease